MKNNLKKWFTIVELMTLVFIIIVLSIITYISIKSYTADARNSRINSDIKNIEKNMIIAQSKWNTLMSFVTPIESKQLAIWANLWGTWLAIWVDYSAWIPNYKILSIKDDDIKDPAGYNYNIWVTTKYNWKYEFVSSIEKWWIKIAYVIWNYIPRINLSDITVTTINTLSWSNYIELNQKDINKFFINDFVNAWTWTTSKKIVAIYPEQKRLVLESAFDWWENTLNLWNSTIPITDIAWLVTSNWTNNTVITNNQNNYLPY